MKSTTRKTGVLPLFCLFALLGWACAANAVSLTAHPKLQAIADQLIAENHYSQAELESIFAKAQVQNSVLQAMRNPAEYKFTWGKYRKLFLQPDRIQQGLEFWQQYNTELARAEREYGVPANIIVAIIGVESKFGKYRGKHKVLDSLVTLVTGFPRRSNFFAKELKHFLILSKENKLATDQVLGSYAGAVGYPQFISSSYRSYAVDFSQDGKVDLIDQPVDAIGSVANYFVKNGWLSGQPVTSEAFYQVNTSVAERANRQRKVRYSANELRALGAPVADLIAPDEKLNVLLLNANEEVPDVSRTDKYIVRAGDTACEIAERFSVPCREFMSINKLNRHGTIYRGQKLKLPSKNEDKNGNQVINSNADSVYREQPRYFFTHENFYVITRYNHSVLYAMAVHDLSQALLEAKLEHEHTDPLLLRDTITPQ